MTEELDFSLKDSEFIRLVSEHIRRRPPHSTTGMRTVFLPWYSPSEGGSIDTLEGIASELRLPLLVLPSHNSSTYDVRLMGDLAATLCPGYKRLTDALEKLPFSPSIEDAILEEIRLQAPVDCRLVVVSLRAGTEADVLTSRLLEWLRKIKVDTVLLLAHRRPEGIVESVHLPLEALRKDILRLILSSKPESEVATKVEVGGSQKRGSFYSRIVDYLRRRTGSPQGKDEPANAEEGEDMADPAWADLLARFCGSNFAAAKAIADEWWRLDKSVDKYLADLTTGGMLQPNNVEEREILQGRLRFLAVLRAVYPLVFHSAADEVDGAEQLYRVHLILCGAASKDTLVVSNLMPFWQERFEDPLFRELFHACFLTVGRGRALVERFESSYQLQQLLTFPHGTSGISDQNGPLSSLVKCYQEWIRMLAKGDPQKNSNEGELSSGTDESLIEREMREQSRKRAQKMLGLALRLVGGTLAAGDALRAAQIMTSVLELLSDDETIERSGFQEVIEQLTDRAISESRGAISFDAKLLQARLYSLRGQAMPALEILRLQRRESNDELRRCAMQIEEAFLQECQGSFMSATDLYVRSLAIAEDFGADELVARASNGCLRCDAAANSKEQKSSLRMKARIIVEVQSARAPELFPMTERDKPMLFVSYRAEARGVTRQMVNVLNAKGSTLGAWADVRLTSDQDFNPTIHRRLHDADAIVLLLSPDYFWSPWCVHELHFALSQHEVRGVPLCWAWCQPKTGEGGRAGSAEQLAQKFILQGLPNLAAERWSYEENHVRERLRRLFARGRLLQRHPVLFERANSPLPKDPLAPDSVVLISEAEATTLCRPLYEIAPHLYRRARLKPLEKLAS